MKKLNLFMPCVIAATILEFAIIIWLNSSLYKRVFNIGILFPVLSIQVVVAYNYSKGRLKAKRPKVALSLFFSVAIVLFLIGKPTYTFKQAKQLVYKSENVTSIVDHEEENYRNTVPIHTDEKRFFILYRDYHFEADDRYFLVHPRTGKVVEMKQPYWH